MTPFELVEPASVEEAIAQIDADDSTVRPIAGGTALMLMMKAGVYRPRKLVSLRKLGGEMRGITVSRRELRIGALTPLAMVEQSPEVARHAPVIPRMMKRLSNIRVRNVATVGGALAHGDPHMDLPPVAIALGARVRVVGAKGNSRTLAVEDLLTGYYETALTPGELITSLEIPVEEGRRSAYAKVTTGSSDDWPALGIAVSLHCEGDVVVSARVAVGAATAKATRLNAVEQLLAGAVFDDGLLAAAGDAAVEEAEILDDLRGSAAYKRELLRIHLRRTISAAFGTQA